MTALIIRAGEWAVLRNGDVVGPIRETGPSNTRDGWPFCTTDREIWIGANGSVENVSGLELPQIIATFPNRDAADAYVWAYLHTLDRRDNPERRRAVAEVPAVDWEQRRWDAMLAALTGIMANPIRWQQIADDYKNGKKTYEQCSTANAVKAASLADALILAAKERAND